MQVRQCQFEQAIYFHVTNGSYTREVRRDLKGEISLKMRSLAGRLSTELLALQLEVID